VTDIAAQPDHLTDSTVAAGLRAEDSGAETAEGSGAAAPRGVDRSDSFTIRDLTRDFGITARTLRHYEDEGLISPHRDGQTRIYSSADRVRLAWILRGRRVGFSLAEIGEMLSLYEAADGREKQRRVTLAKCRARVSDLEAQRRDIDATITELTDFCESIDRLVYDDQTGTWVDAETGEKPDVVTPFIQKDGVPTAS